MSHLQSHPHPGEKPDLPAPLGPDPSQEERDQYRRKAELYNAWVLAMRRHAVAKALDELGTCSKVDMGPTDCIVYVLGISWLEESTSRSVGPDLLTTIFGRFGHL